MKTRIVSLLAAITTVALAACGGGGVEFNVGPAVSPVSPIRNTDFVASESISFNLATAGRTRLMLAGINGSVVVTGAPAASSVTIGGERRVGSDSLVDAQAQLPNLQVEVQEVGNDIIVRTVQPQNSGGRSYVVDYQISVPAALALSIVHVNGSIEVSGMSSNVETNLVNGRTEAKLQVPAGGVIDLEGENGDIDLHVPLGTSAALSAQVSIGTILLQDHFLQNEVRSNTMLQGTLGTGGASVNLKTTNGSIRVDGLV